MANFAARGAGKIARNITVCCFLLALSVGAAWPADASVHSRAVWKKRWIASWVALVAVNALDLHSSRGHGEANPMFRAPDGRFATGKAALIKAGIGGSFFAAQFWAVRGKPDADHYKPLTLANTVAAGALAGIAAHNYSLPAPRAGRP